MGSGSVEEMSKWVEYINFDGVSPMADLRRSNGREKPWDVKYWGVGNENWGCGGNMTADFYADQYRRYATYTRDYGDNRLMKVAGGANSTDYNWTETLMRDIPHWMMWGISLHYYTTNWNNKGSATKFSEKEYFETVERCLNVETALDRHITMMDRYDPARRVALVVDEWGTWWDVEPGTNPGFLYQQNTMRDAILAGVTLNIFNEYSDRVRMANIAQLVNVLQSVILTDGKHMILTPTYHVFDMYSMHQNAVLLSSYLENEEIGPDSSRIPKLSHSVSLSDDGSVNLTIVNTSDTSPETVEIIPVEFNTSKIISAKILTGDMQAHNTFTAPFAVTTADFTDYTINDRGIRADLPAMSIVSLKIL